MNQSSDQQPLHVRSGKPPRYAFGEHQFRFLVTGSQSGGSYSLMEIVSPEGSGPGLHVHTDAEEHFYVDAGNVEFTVGDSTFVASRGDVVHVPRGCPHGFTVRSDSATTIAGYSPAGEETQFLQAGVLLDGSDQG